MMQKIRDFFTRLMEGRYGMDEFNQFLFIAFFVCFFIELFTGGIIATIFNLLSLFILVYLYVRMFSRNHFARQQENLKYQEIKDKITGVFRGGKGSRGAQTDKDHKIYMCPQCGQKVRVPRGRGRVQIRCPKCGRQFIKRT